MSEFRTCSSVSPSDVFDRLACKTRDVLALPRKEFKVSSKNVHAPSFSAKKAMNRGIASKKKRQKMVGGITRPPTYARLVPDITFPQPYRT